MRIAEICRPLAESDVVVGLDFGNREKQHPEIGVAGVAWAVWRSKTESKEFRELEAELAGEKVVGDQELEPVGH